MTVESVGDYLSGRRGSNNSSQQQQDVRGPKSADLLRKFVQQRKLQREEENKQKEIDFEIKQPQINNTKSSSSSSEKENEKTLKDNIQYFRQRLSKKQNETN